MFLEQSIVKEMKYFRSKYDIDNDFWYSDGYIIADSVRDSFVDFWPKISKKLLHFHKFYEIQPENNYDSISKTYKEILYKESMKKNDTIKMKMIQFYLDKTEKREKIKEILK